MAKIYMFPGRIRFSDEVIPYLGKYEAEEFKKNFRRFARKEWGLINNKQYEKNNVALQTDKGVILGIYKLKTAKNKAIDLVFAKPASESLTYVLMLFEFNFIQTIFKDEIGAEKSLEELIKIYFAGEDAEDVFSIN